MVHINKDLFKNEIVKDFIYQISDFFLICYKGYLKNKNVYITKPLEDVMELAYVELTWLIRNFPYGTGWCDYKQWKNEHS